MASTMRIPTEFTAVDKFTSVVTKMTSGVSNFSNTTTAAIDRFNKKANKIAGNMAVAGGAIVAPLGLAINRAVEFEDKMADIAKTTGLSGKPLDDFGKSLLDMSKKTRTSVSELQDISTIGGQLGVVKEQLESFTKAGNEFNVALGGDYSGGLETAILAVGKLNSLYSDTKALQIDEHLQRAGSAFNTLSSSGKSSVENINDFASRIGTLPGVLKPSFTATAGLGAFLEEVGINSERGASGFSTLILTAGKNLPDFAKQMGMGTNAARELLEQDPVAFAQKFSRSLNKLSPDKLANKLNDLKIGGQESIKVVGALGDETNRLSEMIDISTKSFKAGTSLTDEYNIKNQTTAAKLEIAKNNMEALSITVGTQLAPILSKLIDKVLPIVDAFTDWVSENPKLTETIAYLGLGLLGLAVIIKGVTMATALWNLVMAVNPITWIIIGVAALIVLVALIITKWDDWGAAVALFLGPLGLVIMLFKTFYDHWESIKKAFQTGGILGGLKRIGQVLLDVVLKPIQQLLDMLGLDSWAKNIEDLRKGMDLVTDGEIKIQQENKTALTGDMFNSIEKLSPESQNKEIIQSPEQQQQNQMLEMFKGGIAKLDININDPNGMAKIMALTQQGGGVPVNVTSTQGAF